MNAQNLLTELIQLTRKNIGEVEALKKLPIEQLHQKDNVTSWSSLECIAHLNRYGDFYLPEIRKQINASTYQQSDVFKSGILGSYFAKSMLPKEKLNAMKTFQSMNPINSSLDKKTLDKFIEQQQEMLVLLEQSKNTDLTKVKTSISISKWIKLRLGDTFRVVIYHNLRHIVQAKRQVS